MINPRQEKEKRKYSFISDAEEACTHCDTVFSYSQYNETRRLTDHDYKLICCPECGRLIAPCDLCFDIVGQNRPCDNCPFDRDKKIESYTLESLRAINPSFDYEYKVTEKEVEIVNSIIEKHSKLDKTKPHEGDILEVNAKECGQNYPEAHFEDTPSKNKSARICLKTLDQPFIEEHLWTKVSGGPFITLKPDENLTKTGSRNKFFQAVGRLGLRDNGTIQFKINVSVWKLTSQRLD